MIDYILQIPNVELNVWPESPAVDCKYIGLYTMYSAQVNSFTPSIHIHLVPHWARLM